MARTQAAESIHDSPRRRDLQSWDPSAHTEEPLAPGHAEPRRGRFAGIGPKGYRRSDARILEDICERLTADGRLDVREVTVSVDRGHVRLTGSVPDRRMKHRIEDICDGCFGVTEIDNEVRVPRGRSTELRHEPEVDLLGNRTGRDLDHTPH